MRVKNEHNARLRRPSIKTNCLSLTLPVLWRIGALRNAHALSHRNYPDSSAVMINYGDDSV